MTLEDVKAMDRGFLIPREVAELMGCDPQWLRVKARQNPEELPFPVWLVGNRVKVPKAAFIAWMEGKKGRV